MGRYREEILQHMKVGEPYSAHEIAQALGISHNTVLAEFKRIENDHPSLLYSKSFGRITVYIKTRRTPSF